MNKSSLLFAAAFGLTAGAAALAAPSIANAAPVNCYGINGCKATGACSVSQADVDATRQVFSDKFANTKVHVCAGLNECAASSGILAFVGTEQTECFAKSGFLIVTENGVKRIVQQ